MQNILFSNYGHELQATQYPQSVSAFGNGCSSSINDFNNNNAQSQFQQKNIETEKINEFLLFLDLKQKYGHISKQDQTLTRPKALTNQGNGFDRSINYISTRPLIIKMSHKYLKIVENKIIELINKSPYRNCQCMESSEVGLVDIIDQGNKLVKSVNMKGLGISILSQIIGQLLKHKNQIESSKDMNTNQKRANFISLRNLFAIIESEGTFHQEIVDLSNILFAESGTVAIKAMSGARNRSQSRSSTKESSSSKKQRSYQKSRERSRSIYRRHSSSHKRHHSRPKRH